MLVLRIKAAVDKFVVKLKLAADSTLFRVEIWGN